MVSPDETRRVVQGFFAAWTTGKEREARAFMADDMKYVGPLNSYETADALLGPLMKFAKNVQAARVLEIVVEGDRAALLYDCDLPPPVGTLRAATFQRVEQGRIRSYLQAFDATELRKLQARG